MSGRDFVLYPVAGAIAGVALAAVITRADAGLPSPGAALGFVIAAAAVAGGVFAVRAFRRRPRRPSAPRATIVPSTPVAAGAASSPPVVRLPQIGPGYPDVWGVNDTLEVVVEATADGAVSLAAGGKGIGVARLADGRARFNLAVPSPGTVHLDATIAVDGQRLTARRSIRVVRYDEEVQALFGAFRTWAAESFPDTKDALTARELIHALRSRLGPGAADALYEATRVFELVAYGGAGADRGLYVAVVDALTSVATAAEGSAARVAAFEVR